GFLGTVLAPTVFAGLLGVVALLLLIPQRTRRFGIVVLVLLVIVGVPLGTTPVANFVIRPLEDGYTAVEDPKALADSLGEEIRWVVVLGAGHASDSRAAHPGRLGSEALYRLAEGIRLWRALPGARLHLSGWSGPDLVSHAEVVAVAAAARSLGVSEDALALASEDALALASEDALALAPESRDTQEEARAVADRISTEERFLLVTSAVHMDRAIFLFESEGLRPIPAPAYFYSFNLATLVLGDFLPRPENYAKVDAAVHEYLGILWAHIIVIG
ncbi:MAG: hypothetical protein EXR92_06365, partial [Gemmatimonadetes bacterium]|nr:hypothetical protein [Gemmatimonadota bacterium]